MSYVLHPFQRQTIKRGEEALLAGDNLLVASPTGTGKSLMELPLLEIALDMGLTPIMVTVRNVIIDDLKKKADRLGISTRGMLWTPTTYTNRLASGKVRAAEYLIIDEGHRLLAPTWQMLLEANCPVAAFTATPLRGTVQESPEWLSFFQRRHEAITILRAIRQRYLAPFFFIKETMGALRSGLTGDRQQDRACESLVKEQLPDIFDKVMKYDPNRERPTVIMAPTLAAALRIEMYFTRHGLPTQAMHENTEKTARRRMLQQLENNETAIVAINLLTEGVDVQQVARVVVLRESTSPIPYIQGIGRGLRPIYGEGGKPDWGLKADCMVQDFTGNLERFSTQLWDLMELRFEEHDLIIRPDLRVTSSADASLDTARDMAQPTFRFTATKAHDFTLEKDGEQIRVTLGETPAGQWAARVYQDNEATTHCLVNGEWRSKQTSLRPVDFAIAVGGRSDLAWKWIHMLGGGIELACVDSPTVGRLLAYTLVLRLRDSVASSDLSTVAQRLLKSVPPPVVIRSRT